MTTVQQLAVQRTGGNEGSHLMASWKFWATLATAGVYFAGALWGIILFAREREWYEIFGAAFAAGFGAFLLAISRRLQRPTPGKKI
jgi:hypothetical protein